jgi:hypothetical protein
MYSISKVCSLPVTKTLTKSFRVYEMFGLFQSPKFSHKAVQNIKYLVSSSHQNSHTKLYSISNVWSLPVTKILTQSCREYQMFGLFYSPKLSHKAVENMKCLVSSSQKNCHTKLFILPNVWSVLVTKTIKQICTEYQMFGLFQSPKLSYKAVHIIKYLVSSSQQNCHKKI